jgi:hypothetical protein
LDNGTLAGLPSAISVLAPFSPRLNDGAEGWWDLRSIVGKYPVEIAARVFEPLRKIMGDVALNDAMRMMNIGLSSPGEMYGRVVVMSVHDKTSPNHWSKWAFDDYGRSWASLRTGEGEVQVFGDPDDPSIRNLLTQ